jgi:hypothetical protein
MKENAIVNSKFLEYAAKEIDEWEIFKQEDDRTDDLLEEQELEVYPLSIKYDTKRERSLFYIRGSFIIFVLFVFWIFVIDIWKKNIFSDYSIRLGFFADKITKFRIPVTEVDSYSVDTTNCIIYLLENKKSLDHTEVFISADRDTEIEFKRDKLTQNIFVEAEKSGINWYIELYFPPNLNIKSLDFKFFGDKIEDLILYDYKDNSTWDMPLVVDYWNITIKDAHPNIFFKNQHLVKKFDIFGTYCNWDFTDMKIEQMSYHTYTGVLAIVQNKAYEVNKVVMNSPTGAVWASGATVNMNATNWSSDNKSLEELRDLLWSNTFWTTDGYICSYKSKHCGDPEYSSSKKMGLFEITLNDGPIQFTIRDSQYFESKSFYPKDDTFSISSQKLLLTNKEDFSSEPNDPRIYIYEVVGPGYSKTWVHSSSFSYIEARPWLLSMLSLSVLRPRYIRNSIVHIPGGTCPASNIGKIELDLRLENLIKEKSFTKSGHMITLKAEGSYYEIIHTVDDEYRYKEIPFLNHNKFILISLIVSGAIALYSVIVVSYGFIKVLSFFNSHYSKSLSELRRFAIAKKFNQSETNIDRRVQNNKVLQLNLFSAKPILLTNQEDTGYFMTNTEEVNDGDYLSFFQTIELYIDYWIRSKTNSFLEFLTNIYPTEKGFHEIETSKNFKNSCICLEQLKEKYTEFCIKQGYQIREIEEETWLLQEFNLKIEARHGTSTEVYTHIRWKTLFEKFNEQDSLALNKNRHQIVQKIQNNDSIIFDFLHSECKPSVLERDYILLEDLKRRYSDYCKKRHLDPLLCKNITSSIEIENFGAVFDSTFKIPFVKGISSKMIPWETGEYLKIRDNYIPNIVRINVKGKRNIFNSLLAFIVSFRVSTSTIGPNGIMTNLLTVVLHITLLLIIPMIPCLALLWSLLQIELINSGVYQSVFGLGDIFNSSSYDFWYDHIEGKAFLMALLLLSGLLFLIGLIELISFYCTKQINVGRYPVVKSKVKRITSNLFWIMILIFFAIYIAYGSVILIWCILGAVLNPQKFLPMAIGALVFIAFSYRLYSRLTDAHSYILSQANSEVDKGLKESLFETMRKHKKHTNVDSDSSSTVSK